MNRNNDKSKNTLLEILKASTKLGISSFGGPIAHLAYFKSEYVDKRKWLDEKFYADIIALCQFLPGPASSQVGISIGMLRGGLLGGVISWAGFTLPSVIVLSIFAFMYQSFNLESAGWIQGLKIIAVAVVAQAILGMGKKLTPDRQRITIAIIAAALTLAKPSALTQILIIIIAGVAGLMMYHDAHAPDVQHMNISISKRAGIISFVLFFGLLLILPVLRQLTDHRLMSIFDTFYRVGSLVFGGGHVVLPLIERELVPFFISAEEFLAGYGAAQAVPGPLFTFAGYLGAMINGISGIFVGTIAIFLPSFLLIAGALPFLDEFRKHPSFQAALTGINAAVVGILLAALYNPVWTNAIKTSYDFIIAIILFGLLEFWKVAPWKVVIIGAVLGFMLNYVS
ncbi:MAG: ChrA protein [Anaerosolibacter sp.]|uniref:chromate efflux transporter n=1 Tax=Anaerosolibacter sp. TaxID=1872527 RepID=UPI0026326318|nr:chromate efflux transporter [Anaerosolibacter sp.]MDF2547452.1 ChrA protein [Anaerosolibacter sp.]